MDALLAYLHFLAIIGTASLLVVELVLCRVGLDAVAVKRLARIDIAFFITAMLALVTGLLRVYLGAKGPSFYGGNPFFWAKLVTFLLIALISVQPTFRFIRWGRLTQANRDVTIPDTEIKGVRRFIHLEMLLLITLPLWAVLMARGIGF